MGEGDTFDPIHTPLVFWHHNWEWGKEKSLRPSPFACPPFPYLGIGAACLLLCSTFVGRRLTGASHWLCLPWRHRLSPGS